MTNVLAHNVEMVAGRPGIQPRSALPYIEPSAVADQIAKASAMDTDGVHTVNGVRPVGVDGRTVYMPRWVCSRPLMALAPAVKYASSNGDSRTVQHATDLIFEIGLAIGADSASDSAGVPLGLLDEAADIIEQVAARIETDGWSVCPCGEEHGQSAADTKVPGSCEATPSSSGRSAPRATGSSGSIGLSRGVSGARAKWNRRRPGQVPAHEPYDG
ncbi:hypothetical protein ACFCWB_11510 [Streptomyces bacillaris]|uniref:hypothetical protein n=1 Tax=Streptomyces bacillaris TaxID=68179 RepID=UPI0035DC5DFB